MINTYSCNTKFKHFRIICLLHVFNFPGSCGVVTNRLFLWKFDIVQLPSCRYISLIGQVNMDSSALFNVNTAEVKLVHSVVVFGEEIS